MMFQRKFNLVGNNTLASAVAAKYFFSFSSEESLQQALEQRPSELPCLILGGGSNIVFTSDVDGVLLHNSMQGVCCVDEDDDFVWVKAAGGVRWHSLVQWSIQRDYSGLENLSLIPGTVGAAPIQNIGAYGVELCDVFESLEAIELETGRRLTLNKAECDFAYRHSIFKTTNYAGKWIVVSVVLKLNKSPSFKTGYGEIEAELTRRKLSKLTPQLLSDIVATIRKRKLPDPVILPNVGSFFKNPIVNNDKYQEIKEQFPDIVSYGLEGETYKLAAGWMIDSLGWKGREIEGAKVHDKQALVLVNVGGGGAAVVSLSKKIQRDVADTFGVYLEPEPLIL